MKRCSTHTLIMKCVGHVSSVGQKSGKNIKGDIRRERWDMKHIISKWRYASDSKLWSMIIYDDKKDEIYSIKRRVKR